jgi:hypothetical protein
MNDADDAVVVVVENHEITSSSISLLYPFDLKPILFYSGNTNDLLVTEENSDENISKMVSDSERNNFSTDRPIKSNGMSK